MRTGILAVALAACAASAATAGPLGAAPPMPPQVEGRDSARVHGYVREAGTGEPIVLAEVRAAGADVVLTDRDGYFATAPVPAGPVVLRIRAFGYVALDTTVIADGDPVDLALAPAPIPLDPLQVRVRDRAPDPRVRLVGRERLRHVPAALEPDLLRAVQALPGVVAATPVSSRLRVRGGGPDQNQFLLDGFPILYPYHLGGAFSAFHLGAVQDVAFWPGSPPARYGGHLSSVLDIELREGNRERIDGEAMLGVVTSSAALEGPIPGGAAMLALRRTYVDALARAAGSRMPYHFWDVTGKLHVNPTPSDRITFVGFYGRDRLTRVPDVDRPPDVPPDEEFAWTNGVLGLAWRHLFGGAAVFEQRVSRSVFSQHLDLGRTRVGDALADSRHFVELWAARGGLTVHAVPGHTIEIGYELGRRETTHHVEYVVNFVGIGPEALGRTASAEVLQFGGYIEDEIEVGSARARLGVRGERFGRHASIQPRAALSFPVHDVAVLHGWWGRTRQYAHVLQDPDLDLTSLYSLDIWLSAAEEDVAPGAAEHFGLGAEVRLPLETTLRVDGYAKRMEHLFTIPDATDADRRVAIERLEKADGRVLGVDVVVERAAAEGLSGWLGYSFLDARTMVDAGTYPTSRLPRHRLVGLLDWRDGRWRHSVRVEAFEGLPYTPAVASIAHRPFDFGYGRFSPQCEAISIEFLYGPRNSARTGWGRRVDIGTEYRRRTDAGWSWEIGFGLYNALFDPPGIFRPRHPARFPPDACETPIPVEREPELLLPAVPFLTIGIRF